MSFGDQEIIQHYVEAVVSHYAEGGQIQKSLSSMKDTVKTSRCDEIETSVTSRPEETNVTSALKLSATLPGGRYK